MGAGCSCRRERRDVDNVRRVEERTVETIERKAGSMTLARVNQYRMEQVLGKGSFGAVYRASDMARRDAVAVKVMDKAELRKKMKQLGNKPQELMPQGTIVSNSILKEIAVMKRVRHAHCACLFEVIDDPLGDRIFLVMELLLGGQVMDEPNLPANQTFLEEWMARSVFRNLLDGLQYLHCNGILHRDIKPENIVYSERPSFGRGHWMENFDQVGSAVAGSVAGVLHVGTSVCVRACVDSFASAKEKTTRFRSKRRVLRSSTSYFNDTLEKATGTPPYFAPEMLVGKPFRGRPADVWAAGVTLAMITGGRMPYWADNVPEIWRQIERDEPVLAEHLSPPLRELLLLMLRKDPAERPTLAALQEHPWVTDNGALPVSEPPATFTVDEADVATAVQRAFVGLTLFKCASKWKRLPARKRAAREAAKRHGFVSHADWAPDKPFICHDPPSAAAEALSRSSVQKKRGDPPNLQKV
ncbi:calcium calmodulin-dependent protein kinase kinase 1 [Chrysochromulina tobinii]|uniref:Calcium calmodulin-dependent protein kinase kinase 1 n=1 Tax=Chrysochromulina tobinii TaxID=1460289 RepID=A0A0M0K6W7_9EUKA|nr:calcium calmodulin-dependent protein kinase kinase 1 [Chrysochromulina tobinii]|eukprot:KOO34539.1 calcium calmodulin-dependent protein kinase kinase 1 [Chrysochromulina sp. CCMP291]